MSVGCHDLLRREQEPALLVTSVDDVLAVVGSIGEGLRRATARRSPTSAPSSTRSTRWRARVFDGLPARRYARPDEVAARSGVSALDVIRALPALDDAGLVERDGSGLRISARVRAMARPG